MVEEWHGLGHGHRLPPEFGAVGEVTRQHVYRRQRVTLIPSSDQHRRELIRRVFLEPRQGGQRVPPPRRG